MESTFLKFVSFEAFFLPGRRRRQKLFFRGFSKRRQSARAFNQVQQRANACNFVVHEEATEVLYKLVNGLLNWPPSKLSA